jgi:CheY-like chemotaxis protein
MELTNAQVLVLDDDEYLRALLRKLLEGQGMRVSEAGDVDGAFKALVAHAPHLIISDLNMPGQSGFDFIERCRRTPGLREVPIVVLSGNKDKGSVYRAISLGANDYILKPFQAANLTQKLRKVLMNKTVKRYDFAPSEAQSITVTLACNIVEVGESGYRIQAPVRLAPETPIQVQCNLLKELGVAEFPIRTSPRAPMLRSLGQYLNETVSVGLGEPALQKIRSVLRQWR